MGCGASSAAVAPAPASEEKSSSDLKAVAASNMKLVAEDVVIPFNSDARSAASTNAAQSPPSSLCVEDANVMNAVVAFHDSHGATLQPATTTDEDQAYSRPNTRELGAAEPIPTKNSVTKVRRNSKKGSLGTTTTTTNSGANAAAAAAAAGGEGAEVIVSAWGEVVDGAAPKGEEEERVSCELCQRKFSISRIERHVAACQRRKESSARPTFDSRAQRLRLAPLGPVKGGSGAAEALGRSNSSGNGTTALRPVLGAVGVSTLVAGVECE